MATIKFTRALKRFYPELDTLEMAAADVRGVLEGIEQQYQGLSDYLIDERGRLRQHVNIFVDGEMIADREQLTDALNSDSEVFIMQALSGG